MTMRLQGPTMAISIFDSHETNHDFEARLWCPISMISYSLHRPGYQIDREITNLREVTPRD